MEALSLSLLTLILYTWLCSSDANNMGMMMMGPESPTPAPSDEMPPIPSMPAGPFDQPPAEFDTTAAVPEPTSTPGPTPVSESTPSEIGLSFVPDEKDRQCLRWVKTFVECRERFSDTFILTACHKLRLWLEQAMLLAPKAGYKQILTPNQLAYFISVSSCKNLECICDHWEVCRQAKDKLKRRYGFNFTELYEEMKAGADFDGNQDAGSMMSHSVTRKKRQVDLSAERELLRKFGKVTRKEIRVMSNEERNRFFSAMNQLKSDTVDNMTKYDIMIVYHTAEKAPEAHSSAAFLPFHREFLKNLEVALRLVDPSVSLPYWDSTLDHPLPAPGDSVLWSDELYGNGDGEVVTGPFANWTALTDSIVPDLTPSKRIVRGIGENKQAGQYMIDEKAVQAIMAKKSFRNLVYCVDPYLEMVHGANHLFVGGHMIDLRTSPNDPAFFLVHAFVDLIYEQWRQSKPASERSSYVADNETCNPFAKPDMLIQPFQAKIIEGLGNVYLDEFYAYKARPKCSAQNACEGSPYLYCDMPNSRCLSKIRLGGNCTGYERKDICYKSKCVEGTCVPLTSQNTTPPPMGTTTPKSNSSRATAEGMTAADPMQHTTPKSTPKATTTPLSTTAPAATTTVATTTAPTTTPPVTTTVETTTTPVMTTTPPTTTAKPTTTQPATTTPPTTTSPPTTPPPSTPPPTTPPPTTTTTTKAPTTTPEATPSTTTTEPSFVLITGSHRPSKRPVETSTMPTGMHKVTSTSNVLPTEPSTMKPSVTSFDIPTEPPATPQIPEATVSSEALAVSEGPGATTPGQDGATNEIGMSPARTLLPNENSVTKPPEPLPTKELYQLPTDTAGARYTATTPIADEGGVTSEAPMPSHKTTPFVLETATIGVGEIAPITPPSQDSSGSLAPTTTWFPITVLRTQDGNASAAYPKATIISRSNDGKVYAGKHADPNDQPYYTGAAYAAMPCPFTGPNPSKASIVVRDEFGKDCSGFCLDKTGKYAPCKPQVTFDTDPSKSDKIARTANLATAKFLNWKGTERAPDNLLFVCDLPPSPASIPSPTKKPYGATTGQYSIPISDGNYANVVTTTDDAHQVQNGGCLNLHRCCPLWGSVGECQRNVWMQLACESSCGVCSSGANNKAADDACIDYHPRCAEWATTGLCKSYSLWMEENCKKTCGVCSRSTDDLGVLCGSPKKEGCQDYHDDCGGWAKLGECERNLWWMKENCPMACKVCNPGRARTSK